PLGTHVETFTKQGLVGELNTYLMVPRAPGGYLGVRDHKDGKYSLYLRGGAEWQFDAEGRLAAVKNGDVTVRYRWDKEARLHLIEGWHDDAKKASIELTYDGKGRLAAAVGSNKQTVRYGYDNEMRLARVQRPDGVAGYRYQGGLVTKLLHDGK